MIEITDVRKSYGNKHAVKGISFEVKEGEILGFLGPNGAGKSTTLNIITGYLSADSGTVKIVVIDSAPRKPQSHRPHKPYVVGNKLVQRLAVAVLRAFYKQSARAVHSLFNLFSSVTVVPLPTDERTRSPSVKDCITVKPMPLRSFSGSVV